MFPLRNFIKIVVSLFLILLCLPLVRQGMFIDGVWYAAIAKNMAAGLGSIWDPALSKTMFLHFREHPPLGIAIQSLFFYYLGYAFWVERLHCMLLAILQIGVIYLLWCQNIKTKLQSGHFWWMLLLWLMIPINIGMIKNNLLEGSLTLFSTLACFILIRDFNSIKSFILGSLLSSVCLIIGFMCNGPIVFFPLVIPFLYGYFLGKSSLSASLARTLLLSVISGISFVLFFKFFPGALDNMKGYFKVQLMAAITGERDLSFTGWKHFYIFYIYLKDYILVGFIGLLAIALEAFLHQKSFLTLLKLYAKTPWVRFYFFLSLCASLPVGVSHRQMFHYITPSSPMVLLGMMHLTHVAFINALTSMKSRPETFRSLSMSRALTFLCVSAFITVIYQFGGYNRNEQLIKEVKEVAAYLPKGQLIKSSAKIISDFDMPANFARYSQVNFLNIHDDKTPLDSQYYISYPEEMLPKGYEEIPLSLTIFKLAKRQKVQGNF